MSRIAFLGVAAGVACLALAACGSPEPPPPLDAPAVRPPDRVVRLAGAAGATPLVSHLAGVFKDREPGLPLVVDAPIGADGAVRALDAGVLDGALVLADAGAPPRSEAACVALTRPTLVAGPEVPVRSLSPEALASALAGNDAAWPSGLPRRVLLRPADDPGQHALAATSPALQGAFAQALGSARWRVVLRDADLRDQLARTPGAIGVLDSGSLGLHGAPLWPVRLEGVDAPRPLCVWLAPRAEAPERLSAFIRFLLSPQGQALVGDLGYLPAEVAP